ncbi:(2Fe-2S)-binding protein [Pandoraea sp. PE-S2T-3]|uniref:(2Fe-2S)-binding protein n=1 Tax=Pandoraea sp. PE-S2T-3 TaxID=1986993 RepID=UPI000B3F666A|nr:(2Fe-2S)-binding protein [Pandoraea sp. PE-S2T-3]
MSRLMQDLQHSPQLARLAETSRAPVTFYLDGAPVQALTGDTVLTAILMHQRHVRISEFSGAPRAGFCLIGACQDCWVRCEADSADVTDAADAARGHAAAKPQQLTRLRACSTLVRPGMRIVTNAAIAPFANDAESTDFADSADSAEAAPGGQA